jgi:hypothetical protein
MSTNPSHALRLTFTWRGAQISIAGSERVAMIVPASIAAPTQTATTGYSFALLDADGRVLYRRPLHNPLRMDAEAYAPGKGRAIERVPLTAREGQFTVLVPDLADAHSFQLSGPADPQQPDEPARQLLHVDIDTLRKANAPSGTPPRRGTSG